MRRVRRAIIDESPALTISFVDMTNVLVLCAMWGAPVPVIVSERIDPRYYDPGRVWRVLRRLVYPRAAAVVVQTHAVASWARRIAPRVDVRVIPNPVAVERRGPTPGPRARRIVSVGRLVHQKGFDILIDAFALIASRYHGWELMIVGEGPLSDELRRRAMAAGIADRLTLAGVRTDVHDIVAESEIFVLASRFEGFPNMLLEAMALGCAVVATACPSGPEDIVDSEVNGILVPVEDPNALASALSRLIDSPGARARLQQNAVDVLNRYSPGHVLDTWEEVINNHVQPRAQAPAVFLGGAGHG
jgi:GalNAc-alpha-(1->4)-GalNAc-alpha-(1->3)-diNAcBac-PP-undecaprenol alpha-1,4-N-acetyl-D-galactosaminyltransferase